MKEIELLEKLVAVQEQHIELMQDFANLQGSLKSLEEVKNRRINDLCAQIEQQKENYEAAIDVNIALNKQIADLKGQIEELQKLIPIEVVGQGQEEKQI